MYGGGGADLPRVENQKVVRCIMKLRAISSSCSFSCYCCCCLDLWYNVILCYGLRLFWIPLTTLLGADLPPPPPNTIRLGFFNAYKIKSIHSNITKKNRIGIRLVLLLNLIIKKHHKKLRGKSAPPPQLQLSWIYPQIKLGLKRIRTYNTGWPRINQMSIVSCYM